MKDDYLMTYIIYFIKIYYVNVLCMNSYIIQQKFNLLELSLKIIMIHTALFLQC